jgi:hypothetical protein
MRGHSDPSGALLLGLGAGVWFFFKGFRTFREYQVVADTPRMPIRSLAMGFVHVRGKAEPEQLVQSPVSRTPCCFYKVEIDHWQTGERSGEWKRFCTDVDGYQFYVTDETGKVMVDAHAAEYDLPENAHCKVNSSTAATIGVSAASTAELLQYVGFAQMHSMSDRLSQWVEKGFQKAGAADNPQLQAKREAIRDFLQAVPAGLKSGKPNFEVIEKLAGAGGPLADPEKEAKRQMFLEHLHQAEAAQNSNSAPLRVPGSQPASGRYRLREYLVMPGQEYQVSGTCVENSAETSGPGGNMIAKGHKEPTFLISAKKEAEMQTGLRRKALLSVVGGAALALVCLALLLAHLGLF